MDGHTTGKSANAVILEHGQGFRSRPTTYRYGYLPASSICLTYTRKLRFSVAVRRFCWWDIEKPFSEDHSSVQKLLNRSLIT